MTSAGRTGRIIGIMLSLQLVGFIVPFVLLHPLMKPDYITEAAGYAQQIKVAVILLFANGALTIGISVAAWPIFKRYSEPMAMWLIVLGVIMSVLQAIDNVQILSMLSLSQQFVEAGAPTAQYEVTAYMARVTRRWAHYPELFAIDFWVMLFQVILLRFALIPHPLAAFSLVTVALHFVAVPLPGFLGYGINTTLGVPLAIGLFAVSAWLLAKGFKEHDELT